MHCPLVEMNLNNSIKILKVELAKKIWLCFFHKIRQSTAPNRNNRQILKLWNNFKALNLEFHFANLTTGIKCLILTSSGKRKGTYFQIIISNWAVI